MNKEKYKLIPIAYKALALDLTEPRWVNVNKESLKQNIEHLKEKIKNKTLLGELYNPTEFEISLANVSHLITDIYYENDNEIYVNLEILKTPKGNIAKEILDDLRVGIRSTGTQNEQEIIFKKIFTFDLITNE